jgi:hypothetical protein
MRTKKVMRERDEHGPRHVTPAGRSVFYDLFPKAEADEPVIAFDVAERVGTLAEGKRPDSDSSSKAGAVNLVSSVWTC